METKLDSEMPSEAQGPDNLNVKNTKIRRWLTLLGLKTTARAYKRYGACARIAPSVLVKRGKNRDITEAKTMLFIASQTKIPVPRVHCCFTRKGVTYLVMEKVRGKPIAAAWPDLSESQREDILLQLRDLLQQMRALSPPGVGVQSCVGGSLYDSRIPRAKGRFGPFQSIRDFHLWLREGIQLEQCPDHEMNDCYYSYEDKWVPIKSMIAMQDGRTWPAPVFTHGDLNPFNILVREGKIVAIIDWEFSGWYPHYWEYTSAWLGNVTRQAWQNVVPKFLDPYLDEVQMEATRKRWWGDF